MTTEEEFFAEMDEDKRNMVPGKTYAIRLDDCCIQGEIVGVFLHWDFDEYEAVFDIVRIGPRWGKWFPEEQK